MRKLLLALTLATAVSLATVTAAAADPGPIQVSGQSATTSQQSAAASSATQINPSNTNISIRVLSPGNDGDVSQTNSVGSSASAGNQSSTTQSAGQSAAGGPGVQTSQQTAGTSQLSAALSAAQQYGATNTNLPIRVQSPGNAGSVSQENVAGSRADAGNASTTAQSGTQAQGGGQCCHGSSGTPIQTSDQDAATEQAALAGSHAVQENPTNTNISIRVLSPGNDGDVAQANIVGSSASAGNRAATTQTESQSQAAGPCCNGSAVQTASQEAGTGQGAGALSGAAQSDASNEASPVREASYGGVGSVDQANVAGSTAAAGNQATTAQQGSQASAAGTAVQTSDQGALTLQESLAGSHATQTDASNKNAPVRVGSKGDDGDVTQENTVGSRADAANSASTTQSDTQSQARDSYCDCHGSGTPIQTSKQAAHTEQVAAAGSQAVQENPSNTSVSIRVLSPGDGGDVSQANTVGSSASAGNRGGTTQSESQTQAAGPCCGAGIQEASQKAGTAQGAVALSGAEQSDASNAASPTRVQSKGDAGSVEQANVVGSVANAANLAETTQRGSQASAAGTAVQIADQHAGTLQEALAGSAAFQEGASNEASPVRVQSKGDDGSVSQANEVASAAAAGNAAATGQAASQTNAGSNCRCEGLGIQVVGQKAGTAQTAGALSAAVQKFDEHSPCGCGGASGNVASPTRVDSRGDGGDVEQLNAASSRADAGNRAATTQDGSQSQPGGGGLAIQVLGQEGVTLQEALAPSLAFQFGASNDASPTRVSSKGDDGHVDQANDVASEASGGNDAASTQSGRQSIAERPCGCAGLPIQVAGQYAGTRQLAEVLSSAAQERPQNIASPTRVWSRGGLGRTTQANASGSRAASANWSRAGQGVMQNI